MFLLWLAWKNGSFLFFYRKRQREKYSGEQTIFSIELESGIKGLKKTRIDESIVSSKSSILSSNRRESKRKRRKALYFCPVNGCLYTDHNYLQVDEPRVRSDHFVTIRLSNLFMNQSRRFSSETLDSLSTFFLESRFSTIRGKETLSLSLEFPRFRPTSPLSTLVLIDVLIVESRSPLHSRASFLPSFPSSRWKESSIYI